MTLFNASFLWLFIPLALLFFTQKRKRRVDSMHIIVLGLILLALCRPVINRGLQTSVIEAKDIIIALDVSYSMKAKDIAPNRYEFAVKTIEAFLADNPKDSIMLMAFTSNPLLLSPPTTDHVLINTALKSLNPDYILTKGTSLNKLFAKIATFKRKQTNVILMTDGGEDENVETLSKQIKDAHMQLHILGLGTKQGTTIEKSDGTLLKDDKNSLVVSRVHPMLKELAKSVDGTYVEALNSPKSTAIKLQDNIESKDPTSNQIEKKQYNYLELYQIPLLLALLLFLMLHTRAIRYLLPIFIFMGISAEASFFEGHNLKSAYKAYAKNDFNETKKELQQIEIVSLESQIALANSYYKLHEYKKAINIYKSIKSRSSKVKQNLYYNTANAYVMLKEFDKAKMYYAKTLALGEDADTTHNLALVALLKKQNSAQLGIAHPKGQNSDSSKSEKTQSQDEKKESRDADQPSSGSGAGDESKKEKNSDKEKKRLIMDKEEKQPLSSKVYELINKGYIREKQPW